MTKKSENPRKKAAVAEPTVTSLLTANTAPTETSPDTAPKPMTKAALVREMLEAPGGASVRGIIAATGWQAHTVRAALSGLRKSGCVLDRRTGPEGTVYVIAEANQVAPVASTGLDAAGSAADDAVSSTGTTETEPRS